MSVNDIISLLASSGELASIYCFAVVGLVFAFRMVGFADLTIESSFTTGAAICAVCLTKTSISPPVALVLGGTVGLLAGFMTALLHVKGRISRLLSGIIMMTVLYSVNLQIMRKSNIQLVDTRTIFSFVGPHFRFAFLLSLALILLLLSYLFLKTYLGYLLRACGENPDVIKKLGFSSGALVILALVVCNGLTAFSGALAAQYFGYADIGMGTGLIVTGLASLILGETVLPPRTVGRLLLAALVGSLLYRLAFEIGLRLNIHPWNLRIAVGCLLAGALVAKKWLAKKRSCLAVGVDGL